MMFDFIKRKIQGFQKDLQTAKLYCTTLAIHFMNYFKVAAGAAALAKLAFCQLKRGGLL